MKKWIKLPEVKYILVPFTDGPDPVTASEARARGASPARGRGGHHHHIHIQQQPGYIPSMTFRLNVTRELLSLANHLISRLENPNAPPTPAPTIGASRESGEAVGIAAAAIPSSGRPVVTATPEMGEGTKFSKFLVLRYNYLNSFKI